MSRASKWIELHNKHKPPVLEVPYGRDDSKLSWSLGEKGELYIQNDWKDHVPLFQVFVVIKPDAVAKVLAWMNDTFGEEESE